VTRVVFGAITAAAVSTAVHRMRETKRSELRAKTLASELRATNGQLTQTTERLKVALHAGQVGLWQINTRTGDRWLSPELLELFGLEPDSPKAAGGYLSRIHPDDADEAVKHEDRVPGEVTQTRFRIRHEDGGYRWMFSRSMLDPNHSQPYLVYGAMVDVTEDYEKELELERLNDELTDTNRSLESFTKVASHDLRSPLRAIRSLVEFLREDAPQELDEGTESYLDRIDLRASRAEHLIDDLLDYARAGEARDTPSLVEPQRLIEDILETVSQPDGIESVVEIDCGPIFVEATPLATCVRNLVDNAFKHHDNPPGVVSIAVRQGLKIVEIAVADDGPGFPSSQRETIFEPFRKMHARPEVEGSGIGLSVIKRSVEAYGGMITVESEVGSGSTFTLRWPIAALDLVEGSAHNAHSDTASQTELLPSLLR